MRLYVKQVGTNIVFIDVEGKQRFSVGAAAVQKLLGIDVAEGQVWDVRVDRREDLERAYDDYAKMQEL